MREGKLPANLATEAVISVGKEVESMDVVAAIRQRRRESRCKWEQIAVLYRLHNHRDKVAEELAAQDIPFSIENMDVMDTPEVRDLFACLGAIVSERDGARLFPSCRPAAIFHRPQRVARRHEVLPEVLRPECRHSYRAWSDRRRPGRTECGATGSRGDCEGERQ